MRESPIRLLANPMAFVRQARPAVPRSERGYILITLILFVTLLVVAALVTAPFITQQIKRDREEELIHRGVQYSRAIKHYVKKFGRYPTRLEDLENTNNIRFLRRRYKDPITGKDFKLLHMGDIQMSFGPGIAGAVPVSGMNGANPGAPGGIAGGGLSSPGGLNSPGGFSSPGGLNSPGGFNSPGSGFNSPGSFNAPGGAAGGPGGPGSLAGAPGTFPSGQGGAAGQNSPATSGDTNGNQPAGAAETQGTQNQPGSASGGSTTGPQIFGGGPVVGVASTSKDKTIRVFNKKEHYNEWQFIYDPTTDTGGLLMTPNMPGLQGTSGQQRTVAPGAPGAMGGVGGQPQQPGMQPAPGNQPQGMQPPQMPPENEE